MSRIISIIPQKGLLQWVEDDGLKRCGQYSYQACIEHDNGSIEMHPIAALDNIEGDTADEIIKWHDDDKVIRIDYANVELFNDYVTASQKIDYDNIADAVEDVVRCFAESKVYMDDELRNSLRLLQKSLNELFKDK